MAKVLEWTQSLPYVEHVMVWDALYGRSAVRHKLTVAQYNALPADCRRTVETKRLAKVDGNWGLVEFVR